MKWSRCLWRKMTTIFRLFSSSCNANFKTSFWNFPFISFEYIVVGLVFELVEFNGKPPILHSIKIEISRKKHGNVSVISLKNIAKCHGFDCCQYAMIDFDLSNIKIAILSVFFPINFLWMIRLLIWFGRLLSFHFFLFSLLFFHQLIFDNNI